MRIRIDHFFSTCAATVAIHTYTGMKDRSNLIVGKAFYQDWVSFLYVIRPLSNPESLSISGSSRKSIE